MTISLLERARAAGYSTLVAAFRAGLSAAPEDDLMAAIGRWIPMFTGTALRWDRLGLPRENWDMSTAVVGHHDVVHADPHRPPRVVRVLHIPLEHDREVDGAVGALDTLPGIVSAVDGRAAVLFDSGVRTGADAVLLARPYAYGLALAGQAGVRHVPRCLLTELDITLGLSGYSDVAELTLDALVKR